MYNTPRTRSVDALRAAKLKQMVGKSNRFKKNKNDLSRLPPPMRCLRQHIKRVNYRCAQLRRAHRPIVDIPPATDHARKYVNGVLAPDWSDGPTLPPTLDAVLRPQSSRETYETLDDDSEEYSSSQSSDNNSDNGSSDDEL